MERYGIAKLFLVLPVKHGSHSENAVVLRKKHLVKLESECIPFSDFSSEHYVVNFRKLNPQYASFDLKVTFELTEQKIFQGVSTRP
jgi:hypothetical protein